MGNKIDSLDLSSCPFGVNARELEKYKRCIYKHARLERSVKMPFCKSLRDAGK